MPYFKVILENGHMGAGKSYEVKRYIKGRDTLSAISKSRDLPGVKKRNTVDAIKAVTAITKGEYILGRLKEYEDPYLQRSFKGVYRCPICGRSFRAIGSFKRHVNKLISLVFWKMKNEKGARE